MKRKLPFRCQVVDKNPQWVKNQYTGEGYLLLPDAVAVYDTIKGAEMFRDFATVRKGLDWFRKHEPRAYMVLLD